MKLTDAESSDGSIGASGLIVVGGDCRYRAASFVGFRHLVQSYKLDQMCTSRESTMLLLWSRWVKASVLL